VEEVGGTSLFHTLSNKESVD
jgi:hypothetical protein